MDLFLIIDQDRAAMQKLGLACLDRGVAVAMAETLCEGVRILLSRTAAVIVVDVALLRLTAPEHATLFERVAPAVPVIVVVQGCGTVLCTWISLMPTPNPLGRVTMTRTSRVVTGANVPRRSPVLSTRTTLWFCWSCSTRAPAACRASTTRLRVAR